MSDRNPPVKRPLARVTASLSAYSLGAWRAWIALARHLGLAALSGRRRRRPGRRVLGRIAMRISGFAAGPALAGVSTANGESRR